MERWLTGVLETVCVSPLRFDLRSHPTLLHSGITPSHLCCSILWFNRWWWGTGQKKKGWAKERREKGNWAGESSRVKWGLALCQRNPPFASEALSMWCHARVDDGTNTCIDTNAQSHLVKGTRETKKNYVHNSVCVTIVNHTWLQVIFM